MIEDTGAKTLLYLYDFGDGWERSIKVEHIGPANPALSYPRLIEVVGHCPPEDVGGPPGYEEFLAALADPAHDRHAEMVEWYGAPFDPKAVDLVQIERALQDIARRWTRSRKAKPR